LVMVLWNDAPFILSNITSSRVSTSFTLCFVFRYAAGTMEVEPNDPAQKSVYSDPKGYYYPRGQEELNNGPPIPHCPRAVMLRNATTKLIYRSAGESTCLMERPLVSEGLYALRLCLCAYLVFHRWRLRAI
jgi:hypothetical protein